MVQSNEIYSSFYKVRPHLKQPHRSLYYFPVPPLHCTALLPIALHLNFPIPVWLEDTARYAGLLLAPVEGFGLRPRLFLPFRQKKKLIYSVQWDVFQIWTCHYCHSIQMTKTKPYIYIQKKTFFLKKTPKTPTWKFEFLIENQMFNFCLTWLNHFEKKITMEIIY